MSDGSLLPPDGTDRPMDPEVLSNNADSPRFISWRALTVRKAIRAVSSVGLVGFAGWLFQNFLQLRGVVNLEASRIVLGLMWLACFAVACIVTATLKRKLLIRCASGIVLLIGVFWLDAWAPKPTKVLPGKISVEDQNKILRARSDVLAAKVQILESPDYQKQQAALAHLKAEVLRTEKNNSCMIDDLVNSSATQVRPLRFQKGISRSGCCNRLYQFH